MLKDNIELAQEGRLTYELTDDISITQQLRDEQALESLHELTEDSPYVLKSSARILDTSVLVKPSQIHPEREKYVQLLD